MATIKKSFKLKISTQISLSPKNISPSFIPSERNPTLSPSDKDVPQLVFVGLLHTGLCFPRRYISDTPAAAE